jgi:acyl-CoA dehydrogenase
MTRVARASTRSPSTRRIGAWNARLVRDSYLGAIWEGASNVVALDVQRAVLRSGSHEPLLAAVAARLGSVSEPAAKPAVDLVREAAEALRQRVAAWPTLGEDDRQLESRPVAEALFHVLAASLLLAQGQAALARTDDARSLLAAALYAKRWLRPAAAWAPRFGAAETAWLDDLADWRAVPRTALEILAAS